ncbi:response regulator transcription factor [Lederbergia citri]|uniref:Response regulator n=1 Tax=Lederbergia citri TaxID=2833580 RepID=A0A942TJ75_9BACI|nr:response regulator [Lederbergia citri]MBS4197622.1 response regulator [Lederbergia citri]
MLKIMLVDDEKSVLNGLAYILKKHCSEYEIMSMVQSAGEALQVLALTELDVVITDVMMHEMNGIELTKKIKNDYPHISVIVLSGYDDYEYVRNALKNGAFDYLLKPCRYQAIIEVLKNIEKEHFELQSENKKSKHGKILERLLNGQQELSSKWTTETSIHMAVISANKYVDKIFEKFYQELEYVHDTQRMDAVVFENLFVMILHNPVSVEVMKKKLYKYQQRFCSNGVSSIRMVFHSFNYYPKCLMDAYKNCKRIIEFMEFNELTCVMDDKSYTKMIEKQKSISITSYFTGNEVTRMLLGYDDSKLLDYLERNLNQLYHLDFYLDPIRLKREIIWEIAYIEKEIKQHKLEAELPDVIEEFKKIKTLRHLLNLLKRYAMSLYIQFQNKEDSPHYIRASIKYIELHYMEDITLQKVAETVYLNPWYLSSQFKKYTSKSFSEFLNQVRIRAAKELLRHKDLKVYQISEMVGFQDAAYFSTVFKHIEQISPKEFQKTI